ncbi:DUF6443 domain-containing protein [Flavobacterium beibuense]|uniref:Putative cell wall-associated protein n=1 Tax=Flavobacterium beibuense TaxID=657326 RepID=A0A444W852_9FLAO|nr:DUF6443 domain-containing protein [Flavobacterium beibuense]RYJ42050.1 putative cell wall-associated protein [Flavobacterium beibuense]
MKRYIFKSLIMLLPIAAMAQTPTENYIRTTVFRNEIGESGLQYAPQDYKHETVTYYDGLGRPKQIINVAKGDQGQDIITPVVYDEYGRTVLQYLPYADPHQLMPSLDYRDNETLINTLTSYYTSRYSFQMSSSDPNPYSRTFYENSPLGRVIKQAAPGAPWKGVGGSNQDHTIKYDYQLNSSTATADRVKKFSVSFPKISLGSPEDTQLNYKGYYSANELYRTITKDENWTTSDGRDKTTEEFKDKEGKVVLKRAFNNGQPHDTYYVYDRYSNLTYVIPPLASDNILTSFIGLEFQGVNLPWTSIALVNKSLADEYERELAEYDNSEILGIDLLDKYGGQGGFSFSPDANGSLIMTLSMTTTVPMRLRTGEIYDLSAIGNFPDKEMGKIQGTDFEYYFSINRNQLVIDGYGEVPSQYLNTTLSGEPLEYSKNYPWTSVCNVSEQVKRDYENNIAYLDNNEILTTYTSNPYGAIGGVSISIEEDDNFLLSVDIDSDVDFDLKNGMVIPLEIYRSLPDALLGSVQGNGYQYEFSLKGNSLYIYGSGFTRHLGFTRSGVIGTKQTVRQQSLDGLCYIYHYDGRNRVVEKKIPGKGWEDIIYNKLDRVVLTQDENLRSKNQWLFTKYDAFGRIVYTGEWVSYNDRASLQVAVDDHTGPLWEERTKNVNFYDGPQGVYYTDDAYPNQNQILHTIHYYDDYSFDIVVNQIPQTDIYNEPLSFNLKGLATGNKIRALGTDYWTTNLTGYNNKAAVIWSYTNNQFLNSATTVNNDVDFQGLVWQSKTTHEKSGKPSLSIYNTFDYDEADRLEAQHQALTPIIGAGAGSYSHYLFKNIYDEYGQLMEKHVGGRSTLPERLQEIDYIYNIRGWLMGINLGGSVANQKLFALRLDYEGPEYVGTPLYNGNISKVTWQTNNTSTSQRSYLLEYDDLNRLTNASFYPPNALAYQGNPSYKENYTEGNIQYDKNGNILKLDRYGLNEAANTMTKIDQLSYIYGAFSNKLNKVSDDAVDTSGFIDGVNTGNDYAYDGNGNLIMDMNKGISSGNIAYNHLNLPTRISNSNGFVEYVYDATGTKLQKKVYENSAVTYTYYDTGFVYKKETSGNEYLEFFPHPEGYVKPIIKDNYNPDNFDYIYQYKDHLGNVRLTYNDQDNNGWADVIEESNYYPFGLKHKGYNTNVTSTNLGQKYKYNGKELQDELGLNLYDYGARNYDPALGRWMNIDPLAENSRRWSPYNYAYNNPIRFIDPDGMQSEDIVITGNKKQETLDQLRKGSDLIYSMDSNGKVTATQDPNKTLTKADAEILAATTDSSYTVSLNSTDGYTSTDGSGALLTSLGSFDGSVINADGTATANQTINPDFGARVDNHVGRQEGVGVVHETLEAIQEAKRAVATGTGTDVNSRAPKDVAARKANYNAAHNQARALDPRHTDNYNTFEVKETRGYVRYIENSKRQRMVLYIDK